MATLLNKQVICIYLLGLLLLCACTSDSDDELAVPYLELSTEQIDFKMEAETKEATISTNVENWNAVVKNTEDRWCHVQKAESRIIVSVDPNNQKDVRNTTISVVAGNIRKEINVRQLGTEKTILVSPAHIKVPSMGKDITFTVTTNVNNFTITSPDWVIESPKTRNTKNDLIESSHYYTVKRNTAEAREGNVVITDTETPTSAVLTVSQAAESGYETGDLEGIKDDIKIEITGGEASDNSRPAAPFKYTYDGKNDTDEIYLSGTFDPQVGVTMTWNLAENTESVNYLVYDPGRANNGRFGRTKIFWKQDGNTAFEELMEYDFRESASPTRVEFSKPLDRPSAIRITAYSGSGNLVSCNEMSFYQNNPEQFDPLTLFTDLTCSDLLPGITEEDIEKCKIALYRNIAYYMFHNKYEREFRIADYKAYPDPTIQAGLNRTSCYSKLDNPTGIVVKEQEPLIIFVGEEIGQRQLSVLIQNLDTPGKDGFGGPSYPLKKGFNKVIPANKGLAYIMYHTATIEESEQAPKVKIHFASGTVSGYFDSQNPAHKGRWQEFIKKTDYKFFDLVGKYAHATFPTADFRTYTPDGEKLINLLDDICRLEMEFMGLFKYDSPATPRIFRNRMYFNVMYNNSFMYSASYHTGYASGTMQTLCSYETMHQRDNIWGPAHEVGHSNQTRPLLKWIGTTEVTNNILALYVQTSIFGEKESRLQVKGLYEQGLTRKFSSPGVNHALFAYSDGQVFYMLIPFWQLYLYLSKVKGQTDFYKEMFEMARTKDFTPDNNSTNHAEYQFNFVLEACKISKMNLLRFFEKWGFLDEMDQEISDYAKKRITITKTMADNLRAEINALGYPEPEENFDYICDNNVDIFRNSTPMTPGKANVNGNVITVTGGSGVAAYEVLDEKGKIIYVSTYNEFTVPNLKSGWVLKAVPCKGSKVTVTVN